MEIITTTAAEIWKVALGALILGAGLPIVFSLGLRSLYGSRDAVTVGAGRTDVSTRAGASAAARPSAAGMLGAVVCFAIVVAAILFGVVVLIWGKQLFGK